MNGRSEAECGEPGVKCPAGQVLRLEGSGQQVLVVSDFHLGSGREPLTERFDRRENFFADSAFSRFLKFHGKRSGGPGLLVLNGDTFDFVRTVDVPRTPWDFGDWMDALGAVGHQKTREDLEGSISSEERSFGLRTTEVKSVWRIQRMIRGHQLFFNSLAWWVARGGRIVFVIGNHDLELQWDLVQRTIIQALEEPAEKRRIGDVVWFVPGGACIENLYFEHGNSMDPATRVVGANKTKNGEELRLPLASLVNRYLINKLEDIEPFLNNMKPILSALQSIVARHPVQCFTAALRATVPVILSFQWYWLLSGIGIVVFFGALLWLAAAMGTVALILGAALVVDPVVFLGVGGKTLLFVIGGLAAPFLYALLLHVFRKRDFRPAEDPYGRKLFERLKQIGFPDGTEVAYGVLGHTHRADIQMLAENGSPSILYLNSGTWAPMWHRRRPNLRGGTEFSFLRFDWHVDLEEYRHHSLVWRDDRNAPVDNVVMARNRSTG